MSESNPHGSPPGGSASGSGTSRGTRSGLKFQPRKVGRRSEAERQAASQQIDAERREQARAAAAAAPPVPAARRGGLGLRGRGGHAGPGRGAPVAGQAPAPAASSSAAAAAVKDAPAGDSVAVAPAAAAETGSSTVVRPSKGKSESKKRASSRKDAEDKSSLFVDEDYDPDLYRVRDVDHLKADTDSDDDEEDDAQQGPRLRPSALPRTEHVARIKSVNTEATTKASALIRQKALERQKNDSKAAITFSDPDAPDGFKIKVEDDDPGSADPGPFQEAVPEPFGAMVEKHQTEEERQEWDRLTRDRQLLVEELGGLHNPGSPDSDTAMAEGSGSSSAQQPPNSRKVFMFQLPPVLPNLIHAAAPQAPALSSSAAAPPTPATADTVPTAAPITSTPKRTSSQRGRPKGKGKSKAVPDPHPDPAAESEPLPETINLERAAPVPAPSSQPAQAAAQPPAGAGAEDADVQQQHDPPSIAAPDRPSFSGRVGTLRVYANGTARMLWGGIACDVSRGCVGELLQQVVVADCAELSRGAQGGAASASGPGPATESKLGDRASSGLKSDGHDDDGTDWRQLDADDADQRMHDDDADAHENQRQGIALGQLAGSYTVTPAWAALLEKAM